MTARIAAPSTSVWKASPAWPNTSDGMVGPMRNSASSGVPTTSGTTNGRRWRAMLMTAQPAISTATTTTAVTTLRCQLQSRRFSAFNPPATYAMPSIGRLRFQMSVVGA